jgi:hypothetical protein
VTNGIVLTIKRHEILGYFNFSSSLYWQTETKLTIYNENVFLRISKQASADHLWRLANEVSNERTTTYGSKKLEEHRTLNKTQ